MKWFISDPHYAHVNMCRATSAWSLANTRDFKSIAEMNDAIVNSINKYVQQDDELYCLGDWSFAGIENIWNFRKRIICKTIHLILGNHDDHIRKDKVLPNCLASEFYGIPHFEGNIQAQELFTTVQSILELTIDKQLIILFHHPIDHWRDAERGSIHLHGHLHHKIDNCTLNTKFKRMDVGMDWEEFRPYSLDEIKHIMFKRKLLERYETN